MYESSPERLAYAPWESSNLTEVPARLKFAHDFAGHRYLGIAGAGLSGLGGLGAGGAPSGGGPTGGASPVGSRGAYIASTSGPMAGGADAPSGGHSGGGFGGFGGGGQGGGADVGGFGAQAGFGSAPFSLPSLQRVSFRPIAAPVLAPQRTTVVPSKLSDMFFNKQSGGSPPPATPIAAPGRQGGPLGTPAPILTIGDRQSCTTCGGDGGDPLLELRAQRGELEQSIKTEQAQLQTQTRQQQREQITQYQQEERTGQPTTDQEIRDKLRLLDQINQEIASQQGSGASTAHPAGNEPVPLSGSQPSFLDLLRTNFDGFVNDLIHGGECAAVLAKFGVPLAVASALCLGFQQLKGDARAITKWAQDLVGSGQQGGVPTVYTPPPPPPPPQQVRFCMNCLDQNSALKFMSGQGSDGCFLEEEDAHG